MMDGQRLIEALVGNRGERLRLIYALQGDMELIDILSERIREVFYKESGNKIHDKLRQHVHELAERDDAAVQLRLLIDLMKHLELPGRSLNSPERLYMQGDAIAEAAVALLRKQDEFFTGHTLQELHFYQKTAVFDQLDREFESLPADKQEDFFRHLRQIIANLPPRKLAEIHAAVGDVELSSDGLRRALELGGARQLFADRLDVALIASPLFLRGLVGGAKGLLFYKSQKLHERLIPIVLTLLAEPQEEDGEADCTELIAEWNTIAGPYLDLIKEIRDDDRELSELDEEILQCKSTIKRLHHLRHDVIEKQQAVILQIKSKLVVSELTTLKITPAFESFATEYMSRNLMIGALKVNKAHKAGSAGLKGWIAQKKEGWEISRKIQRLEKEQEEALDGMVAEVKSDDGSFCREERAQWQELARKADQLDAELHNWEEKQGALEERFSGVEARRKRCQEARKRLEKEWYGLEHLLAS